MKRIITLFMATFMFAMNFQILSSAEEISDSTTNSNVTENNITSIMQLSASDREVVSRLAALNIMFGKNEGFDPNGILTRAEATAIIARINGILEHHVSGESGYSTFNDVEVGKWYTGYINLAQSKGLVYGVGKNNFAPERELTYQEMLAMLTRTLGADQLVKNLGKWPTNYTNFAIDNGLVNGVGRNFSSKINRLETARLVSNALEQNLWKTTLASTDGTATYSKTDKTLLEDKLDVDIYISRDKRKDSDDRKSYIIQDIDMKDREVVIAGLGTEDVASFVDMTTFLRGMEVDVWIKDNEVIRIIESENTSQEVITVLEIKDICEDYISVKEGSKTKKYEFPSDIDEAILSLNGEVKKYDDIENSLKKEEKRENTKGRIILNQKDEIAFLFLEQYTNVMLVKKVSDEKIYAEDDLKGATTKDLDLEDKECIIKNNIGKQISIEEISKGDVLLYYKGKGSVDYGIMVLSNNELEGKVKGTSAKYLNIDGKKYYVNTLINSNALISKIKAKDEVKVYLDSADRILMLESDSVSSGDYAIITSARAYLDGFGELGAKVKLEYVNGETTSEKYLDFDDMEDEDAFDIDIFARDSKEKLDEQMYKDYSSSLLGKMVRVEEDDDELEIVEFPRTFVKADGETITGVGYDDEDEIVELGNGYRLRIDSEKISTSNMVYRVTDDTKVYVRKNATKAYETKVEEIDWESLDDCTTSDTLKVTLAGIDEDSSEVEVVYIQGDVSRDITANYGVIIDMYYDGEDFIATILTVDGEEEITIDDEDIKKNDLEKYEGALICYSEDSGDVLDPTILLPTDDNLKVVQLYTFKPDNFIMKASLENSTAEDEKVYMELAENFVIINCDDIDKEEGKYEFKNMSQTDSDEPDLLEEDEYFGSSENAQNVYIYMIKTDSDNENDEVAVIIFED